MRVESTCDSEKTTNFSKTRWFNSLQRTKIYDFRVIVQSINDLVFNVL